MPLLLCNLRSLSIVLVVELVVLTAKGAGFAIRTTTIAPALEETLEETSLKFPKSGTQGADKINELQKNEIPSQDTSIKSTQKIYETEESTTLTLHISTPQNKSKENDIQGENYDKPNQTPVLNITQSNNIIAPIQNEPSSLKKIQNGSDNINQEKNVSGSETNTENSTSSSQLYDLPLIAENEFSKISHSKIVSNATRSENTNMNHSQIMTTEIMSTDNTELYDLPLSHKMSSLNTIQSKKGSNRTALANETKNANESLNMSIGTTKLYDLPISAGNTSTNTFQSKHVLKATRLGDRINIANESQNMSIGTTELYDMTISAGDASSGTTESEHVSNTIRSEDTTTSTNQSLDMSTTTTQIHDGTMNTGNLSSSTTESEPVLNTTRSEDTTTSSNKYRDMSTTTTQIHDETISTVNLSSGTTESEPVLNTTRSDDTTTSTNQSPDMSTTTTQLQDQTISTGNLSWSTTESEPVLNTTRSDDTTTSTNQPRDMSTTTTQLQDLTISTVNLSSGTTESEPVLNTTRSDDTATSTNQSPDMSTTTTQLQDQTIRTGNLSWSTTESEPVLNTTRSDDTTTSTNQPRDMSTTTTQLQDQTISTGNLSSSTTESEHVLNVTRSEDPTTSTNQSQDLSITNTQLYDETITPGNSSSNTTETKHVLNPTGLENPTTSAKQSQMQFTITTQLYDVPISTENWSSRIAEAKNISSSAKQSENISTSENVSMSRAKVGNVSISASQPDKMSASESNFGNAAANINQSLNEFLSSMQTFSPENDTKNMFANYSDFTNSDSTYTYTMVTEGINYDETSLTTDIISYATMINNDDKVGDETNFMTSSNISTNKDTTEVNGKDVSAIFSSTMNEKAEQTTEADKISYSTKPVETNDNITTDTLSGIEGSGQSLISNTSELPIFDSAIGGHLGKYNDSKNSTLQQYEHVKENTGSNITYQKEYTAIDRNRMNSQQIDITTEKDEILLGASSTQDIENAFKGTSDITSLQNLKNVLLSSDNKTTINRTHIIRNEPNQTLLTDSSFTTVTTLQDMENKLPQWQSTGPVVVSSLRAGFLDYSSRSTTSASENPNDANSTAQYTSTANLISMNEDTSTPMPASIQAINPMPNNGTDTTNIKNELTSKRLDLAYDALEEELMKEEILYNSRELARKVNYGVNNDTQQVAQVETTTPEDILAVRPISSERPRSTGLYTVSSNYKPLKKIEVQASKPFMRDPDDNSWRNESLSSRGIVFKANNSTKPFTQVLKNKTVWNSLLENSNKEQPALRERLEKVAEMRKSKKKKINQFGETVYSDYEESSGSGSGEKPVESLTMPSLTMVPTLAPETIRDIINYTRPAEPTFGAREHTPASLEIEIKHRQPITNNKQYDYEEDDEPEYTLPNIDLKKFMTSGNSGQEKSRPTPAQAFTGPSKIIPDRPTFPERKPTLQYFPPREKTTSVVMNDYDVEFRNMVNQFTLNAPAKQSYPDPVTVPGIRLSQNKYDALFRHRPTSSPPPGVSSPRAAYSKDGPATAIHRGSYVIKHFRDFIDEVINSDENPPFGVVPEELETVTEKTSTRTSNVYPPPEYYDYEDQFRRRVLSKFIENFNQNSERFKSEFPLLYNTSVVHGGEGGQAAESTAFMRRIYDDAQAIQLAGRGGRAPCDRTVELSPDYELHYYVPEQEEREEMQAGRGR